MMRNMMLMTMRKLADDAEEYDADADDIYDDEDDDANLDIVDTESFKSVKRWEWRITIGDVNDDTFYTDY